MSLSQELPRRMCCLLCFTQDGLDRRYDRKGKVYYSCLACHFRVWAHSESQAFGLLFWSKTLNKELAEVARADLQRAMASGQSITIQIPSAAPQDGRPKFQNA